MAATVRRRRVRTAGAALAAGALLTAGCAGVGAEDPGPLAPAAATEDPSSPATPSPGTTPAPSTTPAPQDPGGSTAGDLRDRLLPSSAFGADATVVSVGLEQLGAGGGWGWGGGWGGGWWGPWHDDDGDGDPDGDGDHDGWDEWSDAVTVEPPQCAATLESLSSLDDQVTEVTAATQVARTPQTQTVEVVAESPALAGLPLPLDQLLADCASVTTTGPWGWSATVELAPLEVPQLGARSAGVRVTVDVSGRDAESVLVGVVVDGSRGLLLAQSAAPDAAEPDPAAFAALLGEAAGAAFD